MDISAVADTPLSNYNAEVETSPYWKKHFLSHLVLLKKKETVMNF